MIDRVERELALPACSEDVWQTIVSDGWLADEVELELVAGGDARFRCGDAAKSGWVEEALAPADSPNGEGRLAFWWSIDGEPATRVELRLVPHADGTKLHVLETRPLEVLDLVGIPLPGSTGRSFGPALVAGSSGRSFGPALVAG